MENAKDKYSRLQLKNQLCFPLYACSKEIVKRYTPLLEQLGLTYTQYLVMMVLWEEKQIHVKALGEFLYLDSGTLTPVLKKLQQKGYLERARDTRDERVLNVTLTPAGAALREQAMFVPEAMGRCIGLPPEETQQLYRLLHKLLAHLNGEKSADSEQD